MEVSGRKESDGKKEHVCQPCQEENVLQKASGFCETCEEHLCITCLKYHRRLKPCKSYILFDNITPKALFPHLSTTTAATTTTEELVKDETLKDKSFHTGVDKIKPEKVIETSLPQVQEEREIPAVEKGKPIEKLVLSENENKEVEAVKVIEEVIPPVPARRKIYETKCPTHPTEEFKYHCRTHDKIVCSVCALKKHKQCTNIDYINEKYETNRRKILLKVNYVEDKVAYIIKKQEDADQISDTSYRKVLSDIRTHRKCVDKFFDDTEKRVRDEFMSFHEKLRKKSDLLEISHKLKQKEELISNTSDGSEIERYISMNAEEGEIDNINKNLEGIFSQPRLHVSYKPRYPLLDLGELEVKKQRDVGLRKLELQRRLNISRDGETCSIADIATPSNDLFQIVLADTKNRRLIVISDRFSVRFHQLQSNPFGITYISDDKSTGEIAISLPYKERIVFVNVGKEISHSKRTPILVECPIGIRYHRPCSSLIVVSNAKGKSNVQCWSVSGQLLRTIASFNYNIDYLNLTSDGRIIFAANEKHCLNIIDLTGKLRKSFSHIDDNMNGPYGIASDQYQSIYVCGRKCLRVVSKEGRWHNILTRNDGFLPQSLHVCDKTGRLCVGQANTRNEFLIFQL